MTNDQKSTINKSNYSYNQKMKYFLTIAASDNSGGAGIQQDIKVAHDLGYWALSAVTGITVQNFKEVFEIEAVKPSLLKHQVEQCCLSFPVDTIKIGAVCSKENIKMIAGCLNKFEIQHVVLDTVLASASGKPFLDGKSLEVMEKELFPLTKLITPNKPEFEMLSGRKIETVDEGVKVAEEKCVEWNTSILLKGGHFEGKNIKEALITKDKVYHFERKRETFNYQHGTGCAFSTALACFSGNSLSFYDIYVRSSEYLVKHYHSLQKLKP